MDRRRYLALAGGCVGAASLAGCFGSAHREPPDEGDVNVDGVGEMVDDDKTVRIVARADGDAALDRTLEFPASDFETTVPSDTYDVVVSVDGEREFSHQWEVTSCANSLHLDLGGYGDEGISAATSAC